MPTELPLVAKKTTPAKSVGVLTGIKAAPKKRQGLSFLHFFRDVGNSFRRFGLGGLKNEFVQNFVIMLKAGISVSDSLETLLLDTSNPSMRAIVNNIMTKVNNGSQLWAAIDDEKFLSPYAIAIIRLGEESGSLAKNMEYLALQQEKDRMLKQKVRMALFYPTIVFMLTLVIMLGLAWFVLPQLTGIISSLNVKLPLATRIIIKIADFFKIHGKYVVPSVFVGLGLFSLLVHYTRLRNVFQRILFRLPGFGAMAQNALIARAGVIIGSLMASGIPPVEAINHLAEGLDVVMYQKFFRKLSERIEHGHSFRTSFAALPEARRLIPIPAQQLIITGEKSGQISQMFLKVSEIYEKKSEEAAAKLPMILEPLLLLFIAGMVGTIAFSILVPIYSIVSSVAG